MKTRIAPCGGEETKGRNTRKGECATSNKGDVGKEGRGGDVNFAPFCSSLPLSVFLLSSFSFLLFRISIERKKDRKIGR